MTRKKGTSGRGHESPWSSPRSTNSSHKNAEGPCAGRRGQKCPYMDEYGRPMQTCSKGKDKNTGAVVWRTTCSRCHKDKDGGTSGTRGQYSRPVVHQQREGDTASNQSDVLWDDDDDEWQRFRHEVDYGDYVGADQDAERDEEQLTGQFEEEPNDGDRLLAALENFLRDTETIRKIGATALDAVSATHEQLAEDTDEYRAWRQRVCSEILRGAVQLAGLAA